MLKDSVSGRKAREAAADDDDRRRGNPHTQGKDASNVSGLSLAGLFQDLGLTNVFHTQTEIERFGGTRRAIRAREREGLACSDMLASVSFLQSSQKARRGSVLCGGVDTFEVRVSHCHELDRAFPPSGPRNGGKKSDDSDNDRFFSQLKNMF